VFLLNVFQGNMQVNRGFRVQFNQAIGPYKGGLVSRKIAHTPCLSSQSSAEPVS